MATGPRSVRSMPRNRRGVCPGVGRAWAPRSRARQVPRLDPHRTGRIGPAARTRTRPRQRTRSLLPRTARDRHWPSRRSADAARETCRRPARRATSVCRPRSRLSGTVACCASPCPLISMHGGSIPPSARVCSTRITSSVTTTGHLKKPSRAATRWRHESWVRQGETLKPSRPRVARRPGSRSFRDWRRTAQPYEPPWKDGHPTCWRLPNPMTRRAFATGKICFIGARSVRGPACRAKP